MGRKKARDTAFICLYQLGFDFDLKLENVLEYSYQENSSTEEEKEYISNLLRGVITNIDVIDEEILKNLKDWSIDRIAKIDLAILRLAIYEIKYIENIPVKVSVNEAVELAKMYGNDTSANFVNGLLAKVIL